MKILLSGGGSGGHFYPIIAIAQEINRIAKEEKLLEAKLYFMSTTPYDERALFENDIKFLRSPAGKIRRYFSILNFFDLFKTVVGVIKASFQVFSLYPDVVFGKGGYASFPAIFAAKIFRIPVVIHESDSVPGKVNLWAGKFAVRIALSYREVASFFPDSKTALTGNPIRKEIKTISREGGHNFFKFEDGLPTILILGGSQGAQVVNDSVLDALPELVKRYQIIHQTGALHFQEVSKTAALILSQGQYQNRYRPLEHLNDLAMKMGAGIADLIISRAGSTIFEIALWGIPSIIIPISKDVSHDQHQNAFSYARSGGCFVIEEINLSPHVLVSEINRLMDNPNLRLKMREGALSFAKPDAAEKIAREIIRIGLSHER